jgi:aryl-alcohol dehydrogenase-like predicted oxidoreductase
LEYVNFGSAGVKVSPIALGLGFRGQDDAKEAERVILHALDSGINLIDCANVYGLMDDAAPTAVRSETILGKALRGRRDDVVITSKVSSVIGPGPNDRGSSRHHIMREVERSLKRLGTDRIDVYILHIWDPTTPLEESLRALDDIQRQGKVRYVGCSNFAAWQVALSLGIQDRIGASRFICAQHPYSLLNRQLEQEMFGLARHEGLGVMAYSPLGVGLLSGLYKPGEAPPEGTLWGTRRQHTFEQMTSGGASKALETVIDIATSRNRSPAQVAMNWVLSKPEITVAISGADTTEHVDDVLGAIGWALSDEEIQQLDEVSLPMKSELDSAGIERRD